MQEEAVTEVADETPQTPAEPAPAVEPAASTDDTTGENEQPEDKPRDDRGRFKGTQARIDELTRARREAERERDYYRQLADQKAKATEAQAPKPTPDRFSDYAEYSEALTEWKAEQKVNELLARRDAEQAQRAEQQAAQAREQTFAERAAQARAALPDFDRVVGSANVEIAPHVREVILDSDTGPQLAYHLAQHPDLAQRISAMSPLAAARELGRMEASFATRASTPARAVSNAPPPISPVRGSAGPATPDPAKLSDDEWWNSRKRR